MSEPFRFRCSTVARWLPRSLGGAVLVAGWIVSTRIYHGVAGTGWTHSRTLVVLFGAAVALAIVRSGATVRTEFEIGSTALRLFHGDYTRELPYEQIVSMSYESSFTRASQWLPALVLIDRFGVRWRMPGLLSDGGRFVRELVAASGREDLASFSSAYDLEHKMSNTRTRLRIGYTVVALVLVLSLLFATGGPSGPTG